MATLGFVDRWFELTPKWLGNAQQKAPFRVRVKRLSRAELEAYQERAAAFFDRNVATAEELAQHFAGIIDGPVGELEIDGEHVTDLAGLMRFAAQESLYLPGSLAPELAGMVTAANTLTQEAAGN